MAFLVLGAGYVGSEILKRHPDAVGTHRAGDKLHPRERILSLDDPATWENIDATGHTVVWTFPARPVERTREFFERCLKGARLVIVLGSTSAYESKGPESSVNEESPLDLAQERVQGEEWLKSRGATVLRLAGIFGPNRTPLGWLQKGLIKNGRKRLNLIHVDDIVDIIDAIAEKEIRGETINAANGESPTWNEVVERYQKAGDLPADFSLPQDEPDARSKIVENERLRELLPGRTFRRVPTGQSEGS